MKLMNDLLFSVLFEYDKNNLLLNINHSSELIRKICELKLKNKFKIYSVDEIKDVKQIIGISPLFGYTENTFPRKINIKFFECSTMFFIIQFEIKSAVILKNRFGWKL